MVRSDVTTVLDFDIYTAHVELDTAGTAGGMERDVFDAEDPGMTGEKLMRMKTVAVSTYQRPLLSSLGMVQLVGRSTRDVQ